MHRVEILKELGKNTILLNLWPEKGGNTSCLSKGQVKQNSVVVIKQPFNGW